ncbi:formate--tetrahydrofolate ligase [Jeotgalibacillus haloalkalitolerans]|uniref:Formate--tetrahydrofolate ligase n=1 Tax=Jeotgalibacillus haloalkalitolerans TaxID=3104292 RepID=A0ABU5KLW5_9BACL|nr:formate--tetrahydrofolate ligase [Jeotgalibacillus sp. HH7-29]MDZ5711956.1 formate--tetrahydrofolate ligase [Jeotgalibacillus sp. HH7-29]
MTTNKTVPSDIDIAQAASMVSINDIAAGAGLTADDIEMYGQYKAKIKFETIERLKTAQDGKLILVTSINPTPAGEGKSTVTVGLADALKASGKNSMVALREPSLGPVMGVKGGATGGGYAQVLPMEDINLHFTGDIHAITTANNALAAFIDNHIHQGNDLEIDPRKVIWKRVMDMNDRALRQIVIGLGGPARGVPREDGFDITVASEIMAVLCLSSDLKDLKNRLSQIVIAYTYQGEPVTVADLDVQGALTLLLKDALKPNLVQTLEQTPALIHGGPFANIAHGCNSVLATKTALKLADYVVTESGFGADLGAEKFLNIKTRTTEKHPDAVVIVATVRALKMHGGKSKKELVNEDTQALKAGLTNLQKHIETVQEFGLPAVVAINKFHTDSDAEISILEDFCKSSQVPFSLTEVWEKGGNGGIDLAAKVINAIDHPGEFSYLYELDLPIKEKINTIIRKVYGGSEAVFSKKAEAQIKQFEAYGWGALPICMAKTQYSLSDDPSQFGRPEGFKVTIREIVPKLGAGFLVALTGDVMTMPGLPKNPAAKNMDVTEDGKGIGLF